MRCVDSIARLLQLLFVNPQIPLSCAQPRFQFIAVVGGDAEQDRQGISDCLRLVLLVLTVEKLILVGYQPLLLEQIVERVLDVRFVTVAAVFKRDINSTTLLSSALTARFMSSGACN